MRPQASFYLLASITISFLAGSAAPTVVFGVYALALLTGLLIAGRVSDHLGRRPVLIAATIAQALVMLMFAIASSAAGLVAARVVQGLTTGAALSAVGAGTLSIVFIVSYISMGVPAIIAGATVRHGNLLATAQVFGAVVMALAAAALIATVLRATSSSQAPARAAARRY